MSRKPAKTQHASTAKPKRNNAPTEARPASSTLADLQEQVSALTRELAEAREQQTATSEVLRVISSSPGLAPVFDAMLANATRICEANFGILYSYENKKFRTVAMLGVPPAFAEWLREPRYWDQSTALGRMVQSKQAVNITDVMAERLYIEGHPQRVAFVEMTGVRSFVAVPMLKDNELTGSICIFRQEVRPFADKQIELVTNFARQAVIAIENARLLNELRQRTDELSQSVVELNALGEVSQAVNSTLDVNTVLTTIVAKAVQLSDTEAGTIYIFDPSRQEFQLRATHGMDEAMVAAIRDRGIGIGETAIGKAPAQRAPIQIADALKDASLVLDVVVQAGFRALLIVPLLRPDRIVGALVVRRKQPGEFPKHTVDVLETFADQSVLAIQNARLFREIEEKSRHAGGNDRRPLQPELPIV
jgi:GAF domain-containing protein